MRNLPVSLTEFIRENEKRHHATGELTQILLHIELAAKVIASQIKKAGLVDIFGTTGATNTSGDSVKTIDTLSNDLLIKTLSSLTQVAAIASEETETLVTLHANGKYIVFFDPIDGSANIDVNTTVGTIFSVYATGEANHLQPGKNQVAAGYVLYGSSVIFVYTTGNGVYGFTLDPAIGSFLLSHPKIHMPRQGKTYSINEGVTPSLATMTKNYLTHLKSLSYSLRYTGTLVADIHRILLHGGVFLYPKSKTYPSGKLRLLFEVNPLSLIISQAGGESLTHSQSPLTLIPDSIHQTTPFITGSKKELALYKTFHEIH